MKQSADEGPHRPVWGLLVLVVGVVFVLAAACAPAAPAPAPPTDVTAPAASAPSTDGTATAPEATPTPDWRATPPPDRVPTIPEIPRPRPTFTLERPPRRPPRYGPHTAGTTIMIAGQRIQLPPDVWVRGYITEALGCPPPVEPCTKPPFYLLVKGDSALAVEEHSGKFYERIAPGEEGAFDALESMLSPLVAP